ncbi:LPD7 domain-containing protein [Caballeronia sp. KNU42]
MGNSDQLGDEDASKTAALLKNVIEPVVSPPAPDKDAVGKLAGTRATDPDPSAPQGAGQASPGTGKPHPAVSPEQTATAPDPGRDDVASAFAPPTALDTGLARKLSTQPLQDPPELIRKRYLRSGNQYFLKDEQHRLAFEDRGARLVTEHSRSDIAESMAEMASAKGWTSIRVGGSDEFKREVWLHASLRGLEVAGYKPQPVDRARLDALREERLTNRIDVRVPVGVDVGSEATGKASEAAMTRESSPVMPPSGDTSSMTAERTTQARGAPSAATSAPQLTGELLAHGEAPYRNNPRNSPSYFVTYADLAGPRTIWGIDLGRAIPAAGAQVGDVVALENRGKRWVTVNVPVLNDAGEVTGVRPKEVYRNTWDVQIREREREYRHEQPAEAARTEGLPQARETLDPIERVREKFWNDSPTLQPVRPLTDADQMKQVHVAVIGEVMRRQGFGERAIERVQAHCAGLVGELQEQGVTIPAPRRYDRNATPTRMRHAPSPSTASQTKEIERAVNHPDPSLPSL